MTADEQAAARAELRRRSWTGGVAPSHSDAELADIEFWRKATPSERLQAVTALVLEMWDDDEGAAVGLQRSIGGVRSLKG